MVATPSLPKTKKGLLKVLDIDYPAISFRAGTSFMWSHHDSAITYPIQAEYKPSFIWSLLHELGHALLSHEDFKHDLDLVRLERDAWDKARELSIVYGTEIPDDHIEACIDTYRDWLYARSLCPNCHQCGLQTARTEYGCAFCSKRWTVSESRLCRVSRRTAKNPA